MKTILFGFNNDEELAAGFYRTDFTNILGEYLDVLNVEGDNYLITEVLQSENGSNNHKIDVREIAKGTDGYYFSNINKTNMCLNLETILNGPESRESLRNRMSIRDILKASGIYSSDAPFDLFPEPRFQAQTPTVTSVAPHLFKGLKEMSKSNHQPSAKSL